MNREEDWVHELIEAIQDIAVKAVEGTKPLEIRIGYVDKVDPLRVELMGGFKVSEKSLTLTNNVIDRDVEVEVEWETETADSHKHMVKGVKTVRLLNGLKVGDKVLILRSQGGEKHIVLDKIV